MPFWRRRRPLHEQLAEGTELLQWEPRNEPLVPPPTTLDVLHGGRPRRWDAVVSAPAPLMTGDTVHFVALPDRTLVVDEAVAEGALDPLVGAIEQQLAPPYRAEGVLRGEVWAVAVNGIEVVELPEDVPGDRIELSMHRGQRHAAIDGEPTLASLPVLETFARERHEDYVARAERIDGNLWEVQVTAL